MRIASVVLNPSCSSIISASSFRSGSSLALTVLDFITFSPLLLNAVQKSHKLNENIDSLFNDYCFFGMYFITRKRTKST